MYYKTYYDSPVGELTIVSDEHNLVGLWISGQKYYLDVLKQELIEEKETEILKHSKQWLDRYFHNEKPSITKLPLAPLGGDFRQLVWKILCEIPYGSVTTYGDIAKRIAWEMKKPSMSAQAVGNAVGHNPISIIIPCHRVVGTNGSLTGYAAGIDKKIQLLKFEGVNMEKLFTPKKRIAL